MGRLTLGLLWLQFSDLAAYMAGFGDDLAAYRYMHPQALARLRCAPALGCLVGRWENSDPNNKKASERAREAARQSDRAAERQSGRAAEAEVTE